MRWIVPALLATGLIASAASPLQAATPESDWPCIQRKVPEISLAAAWTGPPLSDDARHWQQHADVATLVEKLAARRTSLEEGDAEIAKFAESAGADKPAKLMALTAGLFDTLNAERAEVIAGVERYGRKQKQLADQLRAENTKLDAMRADANADQTRLQEATDRLLWDMRIFDERQRSLSFVCEVPVIIEQRLFHLVRSIQKALGS